MAYTFTASDHYPNRDPILLSQVITLPETTGMAHPILLLLDQEDGDYQPTGDLIPLDSTLADFIDEYLDVPGEGATFIIHQDQPQLINSDTQDQLHFITFKGYTRCFILKAIDLNIPLVEDDPVSETRYWGLDDATLPTLD